jgi:type IV secretory pathway VirB10-like protein
MTSKPASKTLALAIGFIVMALTATTALAQWQWVEKDGRKIFSDRPPPAEIAEKDILKRPAGAVRPAAAPLVVTPVTDPAAAAKPAAAPAPKVSAPKLSGKDAELEAKKKKAEEDEAAKKKGEEEKVAKAKAENCERAKTGLATLQSGVRMSSVNSKGEREVFDDAKRASETKRAQEVIDASCK